MRAGREMSRALACAASVVALALASGCPSSDVSRALGAKCEEKAECDERCMPPSEITPGGFCTLSCLDDADCPAGAACADVEGGVCLYRCEEDAGCEFLGEGWACGEEAVRTSGDDGGGDGSEDGDDGDGEDDADDADDDDEVTVCLGSEV